jgi:2-iminobutanoate/2-iminopropanoate deaminase
MILLSGCGHQAIYTTAAPAPLATYSQALRAGNTVYVSGQIALRPDGSMDTSSIRNECRQCLENIKTILAAGGLQMRHIARCTVYLTDLADFGAMNEVYGTYFGKNPPARETVEVRALPKGAHIELSVIAVR